MKTIKLIKGADAIKKEIVSLGQTATKLNDRIQVALLSLLEHAREHNDFQMFNALVESLGKGVRRDAVLAWAEQNTYLSWDKDSKSLRKNKAKSLKSLEEAASMHWTEAKKPPEYVSIDLAKYAKAIESRLDKALEHGDRVSESDLQGFADTMTRMLNKMMAEVERREVAALEAELTK